MNEISAERNYFYPGIFVIRIINAVLGIVEFILALRIALELLGASSASSFVAWLYGVTSSLVSPFAGAFPGLTVGPGMSIDVVAILAMIGYAIIGWLVIRLLYFIFASVRTW